MREVNKRGGGVKVENRGGREARAGNQDKDGSEAPGKRVQDNRAQATIKAIKSNALTDSY